MNIPLPFPLTEAMIKENATAQSFSRGQDYVASVRNLGIRGEALEADVRGSDYAPYRVTVQFDEEGISEAYCTCPYDWGGWCKHIVAALLVSLRSPQEIEERIPLETLLAGLTRDQFQALVLALAARDPSLADIIEVQVGVVRVQSQAGQKPAEARAPAPPPPVEIKAIQREARSIMRNLGAGSSYDGGYWDDDNGLGDELAPVVAQIQAFVDAGDGATALKLLEAVTEEAVAGWEGLGNEPYAEDLFSGLGHAWAEALLTADLTKPEREKWYEKLAAWYARVADWVEEAFEPALMAAKRGWDEPYVRRILAGETVTDEEVDAELEADEDADFDLDILTAARLIVLERQGRTDAYLNLARATEQVQSYTLMLIKLGRIAEATAHALEHLAETTTALVVAKALREHQALPEALRVAEHGLTLTGQKVTLALWARDLAIALGETDRALEAAGIAFAEDPSLPTYRSLQHLSGPRWEELRADLLDHLRKIPRHYGTGPAEIFLHEGLVPDAMAIIDQGGGYGMLKRVVEAAAALPEHADWAIRKVKAYAEPIMNGGKSQNYGEAADWLRLARDAYRAGGREQEWRQYLNQTITLHARKYSLVPLLKQLQ